MMPWLFLHTIYETGMPYTAALTSSASITVRLIQQKTLSPTKPRAISPAFAVRKMAPIVAPQAANLQPIRTKWHGAKITQEVKW